MPSAFIIPNVSNECRRHSNLCQSYQKNVCVNLWSLWTNFSFSKILGLFADNHINFYAFVIIWLIITKTKTAC